MRILGIDIGGSGIKGAPVDLDKGELETKRNRIPTPQPPTPKAVGKVIAEIDAYFKWDGPVGVAFPGIIKSGVVHSAANLDDEWVGVNGRKLFRKKTDSQVALINDADAAGLAEMTYGVGKDKKGLVILLTFGTGIGSGFFIDGHLVPNTEFGHLEFKGDDAEHYAADSIRKKENLSWNEWGERVNQYLHHLDFLFSPDLFIVGGGASKKIDKYIDQIDVKVPIEAAELRNNAGIVGAALWAKQVFER